MDSELVVGGGVALLLWLMSKKKSAQAPVTQKPGDAAQRIQFPTEQGGKSLTAEESLKMIEGGSSKGPNYVIPEKPINTDCGGMRYSSAGCWMPATQPGMMYTQECRPAPSGCSDPLEELPPHEQVKTVGPGETWVPVAGSGRFPEAGGGQIPLPAYQKDHYRTPTPATGSQMTSMMRSPLFRQNPPTGS